MSIGFKLSGPKGSATYKARRPFLKGGKAMPGGKARKDSALHKFLKTIDEPAKARAPAKGGFKFIFKRSPTPGKAQPKARGGKSR